MNWYDFCLIILQVTSVYFEEGWLVTKVYMLSSLAHGHAISGPAIIMDKLSTILIEPGLYIWQHHCKIIYKGGITLATLPPVH